LILVKSELNRIDLCSDTLFKSDYQHLMLFG
jgi:hypothetical protein